MDAASIFIGNKIYTVVEEDAAGDQINAGADETEYADNIATKVTEDAADTLCTATNTLGVLAFTANAGQGADGNDITISTDDPNLTLDAEFADGVSAGNVMQSTTVAHLP